MQSTYQIQRLSVIAFGKNKQKIARKFKITKELKLEIQQPD